MDILKNNNLKSFKYYLDRQINKREAISLFSATSGVPLLDLMYWVLEYNMVDSEIELDISDYLMEHLNTK